MILLLRVISIAILFCLLLVWPANIGFAADKRNNPKTIPAKWSSFKSKERNPAFSVSVKSVLERLKHGEELFLVDVRARKEYEICRIPNSINVPLFSIKTKVFLKSKPLILINEGYNYSQLESECDSLRKDGYKARILIGGMHYWRQHGVSLEGNVFVQRALNRVPPRFFFFEKNYDDWLFIDITDPKNSRASSLIPNSIPIPYLNNAPEFIKVFKEILTLQNNNQNRWILVFDENGEEYDRIERSLNESGLRKVFFLKGGMEAYRDFLSTQSIIRQAKQNPKKKINRCTSCP